MGLFRRGNGGGAESRVAPAGAEAFVAKPVKSLGIRQEPGADEDPLARYAGTIDYYLKQGMLPENLGDQLLPMFTHGLDVDRQGAAALATKITTAWDKKYKSADSSQS